MSDTIRVGDIGTTFTFTVRSSGAIVDISTATQIDGIFEKPGSGSFTKTLTLVTDGTDGKAMYTAEPNILDIDGTWRCQVKVTFPSGVWSSSIHTFTIEGNLE